MVSDAVQDVNDGGGIQRDDDLQRFSGIFLKVVISIQG
jgi:hypothetical protein